MSAVDLGEEVSNTVIRVREEEQEEEEEEEQLEQTETQKLTVCYVLIL